MRRRFKSESLRNFTIYITPTVSPDHLGDLPSIIDLVKHYIRTGTTEDYLIERIRDNYKIEQSIALRVLPLILKDLITPIFYKSIGVDYYTSALSNIGNVELAEPVSKHVKEIYFVLGPCPISKVSLSITGYNNTLYLAFGSVIKDKRIERIFLNALVEMNIPVFVRKEENL